MLEAKEIGPIDLFRTFLNEIAGKRNPAAEEAKNLHKFSGFSEFQLAASANSVCTCLSDSALAGLL